jgi:phosphomannomutase
MRIIVPQRVKALIDSGQAPYPVVRVRDDDGTKLYFEGDSWVLLRFSGTEPVLRIFAEAETPEKSRELADWLMQCAR